MVHKFLPILYEINLAQVMIISEGEMECTVSPVQLLNGKYPKETPRHKNGVTVYLTDLLQLNPLPPHTQVSSYGTVSQ
jgi:hypothetical protein